MDIDIDIDFEDEEEKPPLLGKWAIALVDKGPGSEEAYLMFSSHSEFLIETAKRTRQAGGANFAQLPEVKLVQKATQSLGGKQPAFDRVVRLKLSLRAKYELLRKGLLKDSDSLLASIYRRTFEDTEGDQRDPLNAEKLPPLNAIEQYLPHGGGYFETTADGWSFTGFLLK